jgi:hypothetical protein
MLRSTSEDLVYWTPLKVMNYGDTNREHLYVNRTIPYFRAPHIYVALPARFMYERRVVSDEQLSHMEVSPYGEHVYYNDCSETAFMTTRAGTTRYDRTFMEGFVKPGIGPENWVSRTNYPALNLVQTGPTEMSIYTNQNYAQSTAHLRRYSMRLDGIASLRAEYEGGELLTRPLSFDGNKLSINFSTSAAGGIRVELQTPEGAPIPGFGLFECREQIGNEIEREVTWDSPADLGDLSGQPVRLRIVMKDADLFSFQFQRE